MTRAVQFAAAQASPRLAFTLRGTIAAERKNYARVTANPVVLTLEKFRARRTIYTTHLRARVTARNMKRGGRHRASRNVSSRHSIRLI